jgi:myo-inositol-1(or 4)-monophosphatase
MNENLSTTIDIALETGKLLLEYFQNRNLVTRRKFDQSLVTEADLKADELISKRLKASYPDDDLLSEELNPYSGSHPDRNLWIVDPLDGTTNFSLGLKYWGILIARIVDRVPQLCVNYFPALDELYTALSGEGAQLNREPITVEKPDDQRRLSFFSCCSRTFRNYRVEIPYKIRVFGSAGYSLSSVARGISKLSFEARAKIWDFAGGWLLVNEAGGSCDVLDGREPFPLEPNQDYSRLSFPVITASTADQVSRARKQLIPM